ncbi:hypothetical protein LWI28_026154 [Acer negundo]|uniref:Uncharacterized protein n=1 Tax=Acer negundo TaxID=4023 RepID=A0AAD5NJU7_ACENE|nr:hypothetical protein LWI28_026154 [Acer negundo]
MFWNGDLHRISPWDDSIYFDVDEEKVHDLPIPDTVDVHSRRRFRYFGKSRDHLHLIEIYGPWTALFNVYEMERDYSIWMVKYRVDLLSDAEAFPEMNFCAKEVLRQNRDQGRGGNKSEDCLDTDLHLKIDFNGKRIKISVKISSLSAMEFGISLLLTDNIFENLVSIENLVCDENLQFRRGEQRCVEDGGVEERTAESAWSAVT